MGRRRGLAQRVAIAALVPVFVGASVVLLIAGATPAYALGAVCPPTAGQLTLAAESATTEAGVTTVVCDYQPPAGDVTAPFVVEGRWASTAADPALMPACGLPERSELDSGFFASQTAAATATYQLGPVDTGVRRPGPGVTDGAARSVLAAIEGAAAPCPGPPADLTRVDAATPPQSSTMEELAFYEFVLVCPESVDDLVLTPNGRIWEIGPDWLQRGCAYTLSGVDPDQAQPEQQGRIAVTWNKANGRSERYCLDEATTADNNAATKTISTIYADSHSISVDFNYPIADDARTAAFELAASDLLAATVPYAVVCSNKYEIVFDPIPPYWQPVFGNDPPPEPVILPVEVTAANVVLLEPSTSSSADSGRDAVTAESGTGEARDQESSGSATHTSATQGNESASGSLVPRIVGFFMVLLTIAGLALSILLVRRQTRIRVKWDVVRIAISVVTLVAMAVVLGVQTPVALIGAGIVIGGVLGVLQGRALDIERTSRGLYGKRNAAGVALFGIGLVIVQVAGLAGRAGAVALGLAVGILSAAMTAGLVVGRSRRMAAVTGTGTMVVIVAIGLATVLIAIGSPGLAQSDDPDPFTEYLLDLVDWNDIRLVGGMWAANGKPLLTTVVPRGLTVAPADIERTVAWSITDGSRKGEYEITESYRFALDAEGACCSLTYVADGVRVDGDATTSHHMEGVVDKLRIGRPYWGSRAPFDDPVEYGGTGIDPVPCGRPVAEAEDATWTVKTVDGVDQAASGAPEVVFITECDIKGFGIADALSKAPSPPPEGAAERYQDSIGPCPVLQEIVGPIAQAAQVDDGSMETILNLYRTPNAPACDSWLDLGMPLPGNIQIRSWWELASNDVEYEVNRQNDVNESFVWAKRQYNIYDEEACPLDTNGDVLPPAEGEECFRSQFFHVGSEVRVWTSYTEEGPAYEVRGRMGWGSYWVVCHHCPIGSPIARNTIGAMHSAAGTRTATPPPQSSSSPSAPTPPAEGDDPTSVAAVENTDQPVSDEGVSEIDPAAAAIAATIALIGAGILTGAALTESGTSLGDLPDLLRGGGDDVPPDAGTVPVFIDPYDQTPLAVDSETGKVFWPWDGGDGHWVDADEAPALIQEWDSELDAETARRVADHDAQADRDWDELERRAREDAAQHPALPDDGTPDTPPEAVPPTVLDETPPDAAPPGTGATTPGKEPPSGESPPPTGTPESGEPVPEPPPTAPPAVGGTAPAAPAPPTVPTSPPEPPGAETASPPVKSVVPTDDAPFDDEETWTSRADGSDFLGSDTMDTVATATGALLDAQKKLDETLDDLGISDETRQAITERLAPASERIEAIKDRAELVRDTVNRAKEIADDTDARLTDLRVPERLRDGVTWMRWMMEGLGNFGQGQADDYMAPVTEKLAEVAGGEASDYSSAILPVGEFGREMGKLVVTGAINVKGGSNYGGQLAESPGNPYLGGIWGSDPNGPDDPYANF